MSDQAPPPPIPKLPPIPPDFVLRQLNNILSAGQDGLNWNQVLVAVANSIALILQLQEMRSDATEEELNKFIAALHSHAVEGARAWWNEDGRFTNFWDEKRDDVYTREFLKRYASALELVIAKAQIVRLIPVNPAAVLAAVDQDMLARIAILERRVRDLERKK